MLFFFEGENELTHLAVALHFWWLGSGDQQASLHHACLIGSFKNITELQFILQKNVS